MSTDGKNSEKPTTQYASNKPSITNGQRIMNFFPGLKVRISTRKMLTYQCRADVQIFTWVHKYERWLIPFEYLWPIFFIWYFEPSIFIFNWAGIGGNTWFVSSKIWSPDSIRYIECNFFSKRFVENNHFISLKIIFSTKIYIYIYLDTLMCALLPQSA